MFVGPPIDENFRMTFRQLAAPLGFLGGLVATAVIEGVATHGTSLVGIDLLGGGLIGAALAQKLVTGRVSEWLRIASTGALAVLALIAAVAIVTLSGWS
jgi:hypothetical protein